MVGGDAERCRVVVGRERFFLKNMTVGCSVLAITNVVVVSGQEVFMADRGRKKAL